MYTSYAVQDGSVLSTPVIMVEDRRVALRKETVGSRVWGGFVFCAIYGASLFIVAAGGVALWNWLVAP